jgi:hypothetical protein
LNFKNLTTIFKRPSKAIRNMNEQFGAKKNEMREREERESEREAVRGSYSDRVREGESGRVRWMER